MKKLMPVCIVFMFILSLLGCAKEKNHDFVPLDIINPDTITFESSMKGYELYSWPNGDGWNYSILPGTNRIKSLEEVTDNPITVFGSDSLKMLLDRMPVNENIFWESEAWLERCWSSNHGTLSLPDEETVSEIEAYCLQKNLVLLVSE